MANIVELYGPGMSFYLGTAPKPKPITPALEVRPDFHWSIEMQKS